MSSEHVQRRLAAILAAILAVDVVGSCRLIGIDEEGTLAQLKALRKTLFDPKFAQHHGRIVLSGPLRCRAQFLFCLPRQSRSGCRRRELGVQYVLEGSVRRAGNRIRINAQLIDAANSKHIWVQRYDRDLQDLFSVQDNMTQSIVSVLPGRMQAAAFEHASRKTSNSLDAYDHYLHAKYCHHLYSAEANREAEAHFDRRSSSIRGLLWPMHGRPAR